MQCSLKKMIHNKLKCKIRNNCTTVSSRPQTLFSCLSFSLSMLLLYSHIVEDFHQTSCYLELEVNSHLLELLLEMVSVLQEMMC